MKSICIRILISATVIIFNRHTKQVKKTTSPTIVGEVVFFFFLICVLSTEHKNIRIKQKSPDLSVETNSVFIPTIIKPWCQSFDLHSRSLTNSFVCNFLSSSAGFNLCSCFFPAHPCLPLSFPTSLGLPFHGLLPLPFRFLTSAVSAFFRPLPLGSDYSAFRSFLSLLPGLP